MKQKLIFAVFYFVLQSLGHGELPPFLGGDPLLEERLRNGSTHTSDGFYVRVDVSQASEKSSARASDTVDYKIVVPWKVRGIYFGKYGTMQLENYGRLHILDWRGRTIATIALPFWSDDFHHPGERYVEVTAVRKFAARLEITFDYGTGGQYSALAKVYVVPLRDHLSSTK